MLKRNKKKNRHSEIPKSYKLSLELEKPMTASSEDITSSSISNKVSTSSSLEQHFLLFQSNQRDLLFLQASSESSSMLSDLTKLSTSNPLLSNIDNNEDGQSSESIQHAGIQLPSIPAITVHDQSQRLSHEFVDGAKEGLHLFLL